MSNTMIFSMILTSAIVTVLIRALPFLALQNKKTPDVILYLGKVLPYAIMAMLVVYCLRSTDFSRMFGLSEIIAVFITGASYVYKRNTLVSVILGTISYMVLIQVIFA